MATPPPSSPKMAGPSTPQPPSSTMPSSFDSDPDFFEAGRIRKLWRKIYEEPLIPLGVAATCYALYQAAQGVRSGDHERTNRMFRARIYAQGFTLVAMVAGSIFWQDERMKRKELEKVIIEKQAAEKKAKWIRELERRDQEDREWRERFEGVSQRAKEAEMDFEERKNKVQIGSRENQKDEAIEAAVERRRQAIAAGEDRIKPPVKRKKESMKDAIDTAFGSKSAWEGKKSLVSSDAWSIIESWLGR